ncbi:ESPR-type extended signal peptide-containing protein [Veillonella sp.]|uniref:ESPR-type extended signal peptide-containing protein n=1 Tax=Veillonella sp. TaxID=1926307 RepID=UPI002910A955|nr:ESPR-type extended signal peptide-containing protein [Veillonella sp.]MDU5967153.1 ESPR-type extended signal peptide-containing protein [Veillonella sp.]
MNKIFKVVWNKSKNCYVVVSEFAKNNSGKKKIVVAGIFAALAMTNGNVAFAVNEVPPTTGGASVAFGNGATVTGTNAVGLGKSANVTGADAVGIGNSASVTGANAVGIGKGASVTGLNAVGIGTGATSNKFNVVVIGTDANADSNDSIAIGNGAYSTSSGAALSTASVAVGLKASAVGNTTIAIGTNAKVKNSKQGIAIGGGAADNDGAIVEGDQSIAIGGNTYAKGDASIVIGGDDTDNANSRTVDYTDIRTGNIVSANLQTAVQQLTGVNLGNPRWTTADAGHASVTLGMKAHSGNASIAIGTAADAKTRLSGTTDVTNAVAIGTGAKANRDNSVALGGGSTTDLAGTKQSSYTLPSGVVASWEGGKDTLPGDIVSFGSKGYERQLKNVAPGEVSAHSTDAINGSQLAAIADQLSHKYVSIKSDDTPNKDNTGATANNSIAIGPNASTDNTATSSVAIGDGANTTGRSTVALGLSAQATSANATAVGANSIASEDDTVAVGHGAKATDGNASALGADAIASNIESTAIGHGTAASGASSTALGSRAKAAGTAGVGIGMLANATKDYSIAIGGESSSTADNSIAIGRKSSVSENDGIAIGTRSNASAVKSIAIGDGASATTADSVAIGSKSVASTAAGVAGYNANTGRTDTYANLTGATLTSTLGGVAVGTTGQTRQINYVAAGTADTDAVNVAQLKSVNLAFTGDTGSGDVNLANSKLAVNGDNTYITTTANGKKITIAGKKQDITVTNGVASATAGMADAQNVADAINQAVANSSSSWNLSANGEATTATVEKGNKVDFSGDDNITVARNDKNISVSLKKALTGLNSASFNNAAGNPTVKIDGDKGINAGDMKVTNVADGVDDKDAVNVSQLKKTDDKAEANKTAIARKISLGGNSGSTAEKSLSAGDVKFNVKGADGLTTVASGDDVTVKLDTDTKNKIDNAADKDLSNLNPAGEQKVKDLAAWKVVANSGTAEDVKGGDTVKFIDGDNIEITQAGKNFTIATKKDVTFDNITATQGITAPTVTATTGVVTPQVTGLANRDWTPGLTQPVAGRAATEDQLKQVDNQVATNKQNIADNKTAIDKNTTAIARKISLGGNTGTTSEKSLSTADVKFNVKGDNGLTTVANGDDVTVKLDDTTKAKIDNAADKDLSNLNPAGEQKVKDLAAWKVVANNGTAEDVKGGDTVKYINGDNILITQSGKDFTFATKPDVTFNTVTANDTITAPKVKATTGVETPQVTGLTNKTWDPNNITSGRAATEDQLKAVDDQVKANKDNITQNAGDIATNKTNIAKNAGDIADNKTAINKNAGDIANNAREIAANKDKIDQNTTAIARKISLGSDDGDTDEKSLSTGDVKFNIKGENGITTAANGVDVTVKLDDATKDKIDNAANKDLSNLTPAGEQQVKDLAAWNVVANNGTAEKVQGGDTVKFIDGDNVTITQNGKEFTVATKKDVTFDNVTANQKITAPEVSGLTNTTWVLGQTTPVSGRAATEDQLKAVDDQVTANKANITKNADAIKANKDNIAANKEQIDKNTTAIARKISLGGNTGSTDEKSLSTGDVKFNIKGQNGIVTEANGEDVTVKLDDDTANKINNAANTDLSNLTDAGKQQVKDLSAWNVVANNGTAEKVEGGNTVKFIDGDNISITQNGKDFTIATKKDVTFDTVTANDTITAPKVKATDGVETPEVTGLTNKTWVPGQTQPVSGRAATEDQLKAVDDQVEANKANITKNAGDIAANKAQIDKNTEAIGRKISLGGNTGSTDEKSLSTGDVKFNIKGENGLTTVANGEDVTVKIDDATKAKIDNAANQDLSNLTPAGKQQVKDLSAWNVTAAGGTVEKVQGGDTVKFQAGDNLEVKQDGTTFTYSLAKDVKGLNSVTVGDENGPSTKITPAGTTVKDAAGNATTVNGAGMTINPANSAASPVSLTVDGLNNGGNQIHGVAPGTADTDAVNVSQLKGAQAGLQEAINRVGVETQRVGAHAAAMAALKPIQYDPLEPTQIMAGIGNYRGETAGAIGLAHYKTEDTMFNVGVTLGSSHNMINAGVTHKFGGSRDRKDAIPERYKAGPISSIYVMQDEVSHLRSQNEEYKSKLEQQQSEIDALKAAVNQLLANKA